MIKELNAENFDTEVFGSKIPVLVDFWAVWCPSCRRMISFIDELDKELNGKVLFVKIDVDSQASLAERFLIRSIPTIFIVKDGKIQSRESASFDKDQLKKMLGF